MKSRSKKRLNFRNRFSLSQQDLAAYLGVSLSLVAMSESGKRSLPGEAHEKLVALQKDLEKIQAPKKPGPSLKRLQSKLREQDNKAAEKMQERTEDARYKTKMYQRKLEELSKKQQDQLAWLNLIDQRLAALPENKSSKVERLWFENQQIDVTKRLLRMNKEIGKLGYDIEMLRAVVEVGERFLQRLDK